MIYVDPLMPCAPSERWRWNSACHLFADHDDEMHSFAAAIGLKREWFQKDDRCHHYDLTEAMRHKAIRAGAREVTREEAVRIWRSRAHDPAQLPLL